MKTFITYLTKSSVISIVLLLLAGCYVSVSLKDRPWARHFIGSWKVNHDLIFEQTKAGWGVDGFLHERRGGNDAFYGEKAIVLNTGQVITICDVATAFTETGRHYSLIGQFESDGNSYKFAITQINPKAGLEQIAWITKIK